MIFHYCCSESFLTISSEKRWYHGEVLDLSSGQLIYSGGQVTKFLDVDVDRQSYFELRGYIKELGYTTTCTFSIKPPNNGILKDIHNDMNILDLSCSLEDGEIVEVKTLLLPLILDLILPQLFTTPAATGSASTPTPPTTTVAHRAPSTTIHSTTTPPTTTADPRYPFTVTHSTTTAAPRSPSTTTHATATNPSIEDDDDLVSGTVESDFLEEEGSDYSTEDSVESECGLVGDGEKDYSSNVREEVGKTTVRRARAKVLKDIMGDHIVEFGKILDYKDELLRTNPGSTCVVKLGELDALDLFHGLSGAILNILPVAEHRMCARHILANWAKDWRDLQRRQQFWSIAKSTIESQLRKNVAKMKLLGPEKMMDDLMYYNIEY
ncbi:hypothetical protein KY285_012145 [Solanum tuberosum]|nr:hypothetical protein KY285_012145 [Solanum tuberosum]